MRGVLVRLYATAFAFLAFPLLLNASGNDVSDTLFHHILDSDKWEIVPFLPPVPLPLLHIGPFDIQITKHLVMLAIAAMSLAVVYAVAFRRRSLVHKGVSRNVLEFLVSFVRDDLVYPVMGAEEGRRWLPFFSTMFLLILLSNMMGLVPGFSAATSNISVTLGLALIVMGVILFSGVARLGVVGYFKNMMPEGVPVLIGIPIMVIEVFSNIIKGLVLALRLFANMFAGHMAVLAFIMLIFMMGCVFSLVSYPLAVFTSLLDVLIGFIQAMVFVLLSCIFLDMAIHEH
ncbi:MAG: F0F1 ATP synthase subunit A [Kiritimatiellaeota bacterium]|nr:F0F1 ATP synthase subunit A [Kiritimatiellota bacterium]